MTTLPRTKLELETAILRTGLLQPVQSHIEGRSIWVLCRQLPGTEAAWIKVVQNLLEVSEVNNINILVCRRYLLKEGNLVFGWYIQISGKKVAEVVKAVELLIQEVLEKAKPILESLNKIKPSKESHVTLERPPLKAPKREDSVLSKTGPTIRVVHRSVDSNTGEVVEIKEMPLPHVYRDLNVPSKPQFDPASGKYIGGGRGATYSRKG